MNVKGLVDEVKGKGWWSGVKRFLGRFVEFLDLLRMRRRYGDRATDS
jgi:hypothetical protein